MKATVRPQRPLEPEPEPLRAERSIAAARGRRPSCRGVPSSLLKEPHTFSAWRGRRGEERRERRQLEMQGGPGAV